MIVLESHVSKEIPGYDYKWQPNIQKKNNNNKKFKIVDSFENKKHCPVFGQEISTQFPL